MRTRPSLASLFFTFGFVLACEPGSNSTGTPNTGGSPSQGGAGAGSTQGGNENNGGSTTNFMGSGGSGPGSCTSGPNDDLDGDGFTVAAGDCNDCDPNTNPGALEVAGDDGTGGGGGYVAVDEDCDGTVDNVAVASCDDSLALDSADPLDGARAIELCKQAANDQDWGVVSAQWVRADGSPATATQQVGILTTFGTNNLPRAGARLLGLSSGRARTPGQPGACGSASCAGTGLGTPPPGYPQNAPGCQISDAIYDDIGLELAVRAPTNATGYKFDFKFYSFEYAEWVCTTFNDQFMALVNPAPAGALDGNISFGSNGAPVSVNIAFFDVCEGCQNWAQNCGSGCPPPPAMCCPAGTAELAGTGFDTWSGTFDDGNAGGTSWLQTQAPVEGGSTFTIRYGIWDTGDGNLDATSVIDNFEWIANGGTVTVGTTPVPE